MLLMVESIVFTLSVCLSIVLLNLYGEKQKVKSLRGILQGVRKKKLKRLLKEIKRKTFHLVGLLIPLIFYFGTEENLVTEEFCVLLLGFLSVGSFGSDYLRRNNATFRRIFMTLFPILREKEMNTYTGTSWLFLGSMITIFFFEKVIATSALMYLIIGDTCAAIFGITYGKRVLVGKKTLEGTMAMFFACLGIGLFCFRNVRLFEYIALVGAISASLSELLVEGINDNLHIPIISSIFMSLAWFRLKPLELETCQ